MTEEQVCKTVENYAQINKLLGRMEFQAAAKEWQKEFKGVKPLNAFLDAQLSLIYKVPHLDIVAFDEYLQKEFKSYTDNMGMDGFVTEKFGVAARNLILRLI